MKLKYSLLIGISLFLGEIQAVTKDSIVFLQDTIQLADSKFARLTTKEQQLLKKVSNEPNRYIANNIGSFVGNVNRVIVADPLDDGITKILVIGNSFSDDGVEYYFHDLAKQNGKSLVIGNLFRGGAALDFHLKNAETDNKIYSYRKTTIDNIKTNTNRTSILQALQDENWDYICFQQASVTSGDMASVQESLPSLFKYVKENYLYPTVKYIYHQTWAYGQNAVTANFERYDRNQQLMYNKIVDVSKEIKNIIPLYRMIPSGTAIQNGRTSYLGDNFTREAYHLDLLIGRFTAACTWYETIFGNVKSNAFKPYNVNEHQAAIAKEAAYQAVRSPFEVSRLQDYQHQPVYNNQVNKVQVNFGHDLVMAGWNSFLYEKAGRKMFSLQDENNVTSDINIEVTHSFDKRDMQGPSRTSVGNWKLPKEVSQSNFNTEIDTSNAGKPFIVISNLKPQQSYAIEIYASSNTSAESYNYFLVKGDNSKKIKHHVGNNLAETIYLKDIKADKNGKIEIGYDLPNNEKSYTGFINALSIELIKTN